MPPFPKRNSVLLQPTPKVDTGPPSYQQKILRDIQAQEEGKKRTTPLWSGPEQDGVTFSLLSRFLVCKERFRALVVDGIKTNEGFNHRLAYGEAWHICEEFHAQGQAWEGALKNWANNQCYTYPTQQEEIRKYYHCCRIQFPVYLAYWEKNPDVIGRENILAERVFDVPYALPSGRKVKLKGKFDSGDLILPESNEQGLGFWLQENKTKGDVRPYLLQRQLKFDLQTMLYLSAMYRYFADNYDRRMVGIPIKGIRYNVIRRPLAGGLHSIVRHKGTDGPKCTKCKGAGGECLKCGGRGRTGGKPEETPEHYYNRLAEKIRDNGQDFFFRWKIPVSKEDVAKFERECLTPILEHLWDWWEWILFSRSMNCDPYSVSSPGRWGNSGGGGMHWRHPFGVWNVLNEGGATDLDEYLENGSEAGLTRTEDLFPELR